VVERVSGEKVVKGQIMYIAHWIGYEKTSLEPRECLEADGLLNVHLKDYLDRKATAGSKRRKPNSRARPSHKE
jgi:hypothetical protein